jgi:DNA (cytosine-5)-methyltransferase 1
MADPMGRPVIVVNGDRLRVLSRLGLHGDLGLDLKKIRESRRQALLPEFIPPNLRASLHRSLLVHAIERCHKRQPKCTGCPLRKFCRFYRNQQAGGKQKRNSPTVIDLFCGAGGMSSGFVRAGFQPVLAVDSDETAARTYSLNHPELPSENVLVADIRTLTLREIQKLIGRSAPDVLVGSPPCQGYSLTGKRSKIGRGASEFHSVAGGRNSRENNQKTDYHTAGDERNYLFEFMVDLAIELRPRLFLMENVPGMKSARMGRTSFFDAAKRQLESGGYQTATWELNASAFGVPQDRKRLFLVASRLRDLPARPEEEYGDISSRVFDEYALPPITFKEATIGLPPLKPDSGEAVSRNLHESGDTSEFRRYLGKFQIMDSPELVFNHKARYQNERDLELYELLEPGENSVHAVERHGRRDLMRYRQDAFDDKYLKLRGDRPCRTIVAHLAKDGNGFIHPEQVRSITVREAARIQSFDDSYMFCGAPRDQWVQVGNAVPPLLAEAIARSFLAILGVRKR